MEEDVGFLSANGDVGSCAFRDRVRGRGDILVLFIVFEGLLAICLDALDCCQTGWWPKGDDTHRFLPQIGIWDHYLQEPISGYLSLNTAGGKYCVILDGLHRLLILILDLDLLPRRRIRRRSRLALGDLPLPMREGFIVLRSALLWGLAFLMLRYVLLPFLSDLLVNLPVPLSLLGIDRRHEFLNLRDRISRTPVLPDTVLFGGTRSLRLSCHFGGAYEAETTA